MVKSAFLFPGQGAQYVGMGKDLYETNTVAKEYFDKASEILGFNIADLCFSGPEAELTRTINSQPAIFVVSIAFLKALEDKCSHLKPALTCGLSLGEYTALVASGVLGFEDALKLVRRRGELMENAGQENPGSMASIIGLDVAKCREICNESKAELANLNSPEQTVISGTKGAIQQAITLAEKAGAKRAIELNVSGAFHSSLMQSAADGLKEALAVIDFSEPKIPVITNVTADYVKTVQDVKNNLSKQVTSSVRWVETIQRLSAEGVTQCYEIGPGKVLKGLARRINKELSVQCVGSVEELDKLQTELTV